MRKPPKWRGPRRASSKCETFSASVPEAEVHMEHRWGNRVATDLRVQVFVDPASTAWGKLRDISVSGGFLETELQVPVLSTLCMTVPATRTEGVRVIHAIVIRDVDDGVGVEWFDNDAEAVAQLIQELRNRNVPRVYVRERRDSWANL